MLTTDEYYEMLLKKGPDSTRAQAEYVRRLYKGDWHLSDEEILREISLFSERVINDPLLRDGMHWE